MKKWEGIKLSSIFNNGMGDKKSKIFSRTSLFYAILILVPAFFISAALTSPIEGVFLALVILVILRPPFDIDP